MSHHAGLVPIGIRHGAVIPLPLIVKATALTSKSPPLGHAPIVLPRLSPNFGSIRPSPGMVVLSTAGRLVIDSGGGGNAKVTPTGGVFLPTLVTSPPPLPLSPLPRNRLLINVSAGVAAGKLIRIPLPAPRVYDS